MTSRGTHLAAALLALGSMLHPRAASGDPAGHAAGPSQPTGDFDHAPAKEQRTDTPLPIYVRYPGAEALVRVVVKYKGARMTDWRRLDLKRMADGWGGLVPCDDVAEGTVRYWIAGFDAAGDPVATSGNVRQPFVVPIRDDGGREAPALPGQKPPRRCSTSPESPQESEPAERTTSADKEFSIERNEPRKAAPEPESESESEDTTQKRASIELAAYSDSDHVTVFTPSINLGVDNVSGSSFSASYLVDVVSAASVDIVSTASARWQETRQAGTLAGQFKPHDFGVGFGGSISREPDYLSYGAFGTVVKEFDQKNWTVNLGYGFSHDTIGRCGADGACTPFSVFSRQLLRGSFTGGLAWVVDRSTLASLSLDVVIENGDQSKPYRYIPMFASNVAPNVASGASIDWVNANRLPERPLEQLPLERHRAALTGQYAHRLNGSTLRLEERFYDDDWGLVASTSDARWIFDWGGRVEVWPHARFHAQSSVTFWQKAYVSASSTGWDLPEYRTGDRELGPLMTAGGGFGLRAYLGRTGREEEWSIQLTWDGMYTAFLDDLYVAHRLATLGALTFVGAL